MPDPEGLSWIAGTLMEQMREVADSGAAAAIKRLLPNSPDQITRLGGTD